MEELKHGTWIPGQRQHGNTVKHFDHGGKIGIGEATEDKAVVNGIEPDSKRSLIIHFLAVAEGDQRKQQAGYDRQNDLIPHPNAFLTGEHEAGHYRANHAKHHQPGQHIFIADI